MKRFEFKKRLVESILPPVGKDVIWVDVNESTGRVFSMKERDINGNFVDATDIISEKANGVKVIDIELNDTTHMPDASTALDLIKTDGTTCVRYEDNYISLYFYGTITTEVSGTTVTQTAYLPYIDEDLDDVAIKYVQRTFNGTSWGNWGTPA